MKTFSSVLLITLAAISGGVYADETNRVPSCYATNKMEMAAPAPQHEVFILLDETTPLDDNLKAKLYSITQSLIRPGVRFSVLSFSAYAQGRYLNRHVAGVVELPLSEKARPSIGAKVLKKFDACMAAQELYGCNLALKAEKQVLDQATVDLKKSDVIANLSEVSHLVKASPAPKKTLLVVSDMLENSSIASFYAKNAVRRLDPDKELATVAREKMLGDFGGAEVYVMGAGIVPEMGKAVYRDPKTMGSLKSFWQAYFTKSNGNLVEFGAPELLSPPH